MSWRLMLSGMVAALIAVPSASPAQLPERRLPPPGANPGVVNPPQPGTMDPGIGTGGPRTEPPDPGTGTLDPGNGTLDPVMAAPPAVRPGTIQREPAPLPSREPVYSAPGEVPANVRVAATGARSVTLEWSPTTGAYAYWVHQSQANGQFYRGGSSTTETAFTVTRLLPGTAYSFRVSATYPQEMQRREGVSEPVSATTAEAPAVTGLTATVTDKGQVTLTWDKVPEADWYRLFRNGAVLSDVRPVSLALNAPPVQRTSFFDQVGPGSYQYQAQAVYGTDAGQVTSERAPVPPVIITIKPSTRVRYCQAIDGPSTCGQPGSTPATISAMTTLRRSGRGTP